MLARVAESTQKIELVGEAPSAQNDNDTVMVLFPQGDGRVLSSTTRSIQGLDKIQSLQFGPYGLIVFQKVD